MSAKRATEEIDLLIEAAFGWSLPVGPSTAKPAHSPHRQVTFASLEGTRAI
jgi:hypothetical protein